MNVKQKHENEIGIFLEKQNKADFITNRPSLKQLLEDVLQEEKRKKKMTPEGRTEEEMVNKEISKHMDNSRQTLSKKYPKLLIKNKNGIQCVWLKKQERLLDSNNSQVGEEKERLEREVGVF